MKTGEFPLTETNQFSRSFLLGGHVELLPEALEDGSEEVGGVEAGHGDEEQVEGVAHLLAGQDHGGQDVAHDPQDGHGRLGERRKECRLQGCAA